MIIITEATRSMARRQVRCMVPANTPKASTSGMVPAQKLAMESAPAAKLPLAMA